MLFADIGLSVAREKADPTVRIGRAFS